MSNELASLYENVPIYNFGNITLINGDILRFENEDHYNNVYKNLINQYEAWSNLFFQKYNNELVLDSIIEKLEFDDYTPLILFEENYSFSNNLRSICLENEELWLQNEAIGNFPDDEIIPCPIEQTLYSKFHEICIGDTIYQHRSDGSIVYFPISEIGYIQSVRNALSEEELNKLKIENPKITICHDITECYWSSYFKNGMQYHSEAGEKKFTWTYKYDQATSYSHHNRTKVTMRNYIKKNGEWKRDYAICALSSEASLYTFMFLARTCTYNSENPSIMQTPNKFYLRTQIWQTLHKPCTITGTTSYGGISTNNEIIDGTYTVDPFESYIKCRHEGWTFQFNAGTGVTE